MHTGDNSGVSNELISHFAIEQRTGSSRCLEGRSEGRQQVIVSELI
jgi:hypothetical protein